MSELGKSLIQEGMEKGIKKKTLDVVKKGLYNETIKELTDLDIEKIQLIRETIE